MDNNKKRVFASFTILLTFSILSLFYENGIVEKIEKLLNQKKYEEVIELSSDILDDPRIQINERKKIFIYKAISEYNLKQKLNAKITFLQLISLDQEIKIESAYLTPNIIDFFNELKDQYLFQEKPKIMDLETANAAD
jgi:hypothetical protein